jgi:hypothetical protein
MSTQGCLDFTPAARQLSAELRSRETKARAVLELLRMGAARRSEMMAAGGDRFSARVNELRAEGHWIVGPQKAPRWGINERTEPFADGEDMYLLVEPHP